VLPIFVAEAESNLPGPPLKLRCQILVIENVVLNRAAATGTLKTTSQAALNVLASLQLRGFGTHALYAEKNPISPEKVDAGFEAHLVTLYVRSGMEAPAKPLQVTGSMSEGEGAYQTHQLAITGTNTGGDNKRISYTVWTNLRGFPGYHSGQTMVQNNATPDVWGPLVCASINGLTLAQGGGLTASYNPITDKITLVSPVMAANDDTMKLQVNNYDTVGIPTQTSTQTIAGNPPPALTLACGTSGAAIRYTTDGTYPTPEDGTLYSAPIPPPEAGTIVRAVAYATGMVPSDLTELLITD
jgi:hypothetical protein